MSAPAMSAASTAHWRAMSTTRLLDCGMVYADVMTLEREAAAGRAWDDVCEALGQAHLDAAEGAVGQGRTITAARRFRAAAAGFLFAQMAFNFDDARKIALYGRFSHCVGRLATVCPNPMERIELPFGAGRLVGWYTAPKDQPILGTVVVFGGQSGWGATYLRNADALAQRGIGTVLAEGPGQGETRMRFGIHLDVDVAAAYGEFVGYAAERTQRPVGVWGNSVGGLFAALTAACDDRVAACCVNGGFAAARLLPFRTFAEQAGAMLGTADPDAIEANFARLRFDPADQHIDAPLLVLHGGADPLVALPDQQPFLDGAGDATLKVWPDGDHTIYNHGDERNDYVADWFLDVFGGQHAGVR
ncbi:alpha/beta hydrolase family protein [Gordonia sp. NPDC003424]